MEYREFEKRQKNLIYRLIAFCSWHGHGGIRHTSHTTAPLLKKFISSPPIVKVNPQNKGTFTVSSVSSEISYIFQRETRHTSSVWWCVLCRITNVLKTFETASLRGVNTDPGPRSEARYPRP